MQKTIAIVGGGPAGAMCGERLARAGHRVTIYDERMAWEKPCGGGLTYKALETYPFLLEGDHPKKIVRTAEMVAGDARARLELDKPLAIFSREVLNGLLLKRAQAAGCRMVRTRVTRVETDGPEVRVRSGTDVEAADFVVLAAGARNSLLPGTTPLTSAELEQTVGYFVPLPAGAHTNSRAADNADVLKVKFPERLGGYIWSFPRLDHLSVGICAPIERTTARRLRQQVHKFLHEEGAPGAGASPEDAPSGARFFSHVLPSPRARTLRERKVLGHNWALVGDAAAWVDPLTGEGLYYAMRSGDLLGQSLARGAPEEYVTRVRQEFTSDLEVAVRAARRFFEGSVLGGPVARRMVQFVRRSPTIQRIACDLCSGAQDYRTLKHRLFSRAWLVLTEILGNLLRGRRVDVAPNP